MKETFHYPFFARDVAMYANGNVPERNPFKKALTQASLWSLIGSHKEEGTLDMQARLSAYGLGLGRQSGYPGPNRMVAKLVTGGEEGMSFGLVPSDEGLDAILLPAGGQVSDAVEIWSLPLAEGMDAIDAMLDRVSRDISVRLAPGKVPTETTATAMRR